MNRLAQCEKNDFASNLVRLGFTQFGDCTFIGETIKVFRTNKTHSERVRYWEVQDIANEQVYFRSNHCDEVLRFLLGSTFFTDGAILLINYVIKKPKQAITSTATKEPI